jgi:hypothetical protein
MARRRKPSLPRLDVEQRPPQPPPTIAHGAHDTRRAQRRRRRAEDRARLRRGDVDD